MACTNAGLEVRLHDASREGLDRGVQTIQRNYAVSVARKRFTEDAVAERMARITPQLDLAGFDTVDVVIEAVFEDMALKREIFSALDRVARPDAVLATNTSTLDIDAIASATSRPEASGRPAFLQPRQRDAAARNRPRSIDVRPDAGDIAGAWPRSSARWAWWSGTGRVSSAIA